MILNKKGIDFIVSYTEFTLSDGDFIYGLYYGFEVLSVYCKSSGCNFCFILKNVKPDKAINKIYDYFFSSENYCFDSGIFGLQTLDSMLRNINSGKETWSGWNIPKSLSF